MAGSVVDVRFTDRLAWNGSKKTLDLQDGSIYILNVTLNDTGTYRCYFDRTLVFDYYEFHTNTTKFINLNVVPKGEKVPLNSESSVKLSPAVLHR